MGIKVIFKNAHFEYPIEGVTAPSFNYSTGRYTTENPTGVIFVQDGTCKCELVAEFGSTIYYTIDGTTPTENSQQYSTPFTLTGIETIKAIAVKDETYSDMVSLDVAPILMDITKDITLNSQSDHTDALAIGENWPSRFSTPAFFKLSLVYNKNMSDMKNQITLGSKNSYNPYPAQAAHSVTANEPYVLYIGSNTLTVTGLQVKSYSSNGTPYNVWGEGDISIHAKVTKLNTTLVDTVSKSGNTSGTLFTDLDPSKRYGVKVVVTNATPSSGQTAINFMLRDIQGSNGAANNQFITGNGTYMIPVHIDSTHTTISFNCYQGTCDFEATLYELTE